MLCPFSDIHIRYINDISNGFLDRANTSAGYRLHRILQHGQYRSNCCHSAGCYQFSNKHHYFSNHQRSGTVYYVLCMGEIQLFHH